MPGNRPRIVILGGGFSGAYCAQALERRLRPDDADILLIDRHNYFPFYPLLVEAGTGDLEPRHAVVSIRAFLRRTSFLMAEITGAALRAGRIDAKVVGSDEPHSIDFDHLVIALGSVTNLPPVPGLREHAWQIKNLAEAIQLRDRAIRMLEAASATDDSGRRRTLLHFVIVGANFTGAEVAGELEAFLRQAIRREYRRIRPGECSITLIDRGDRILSALDPELSEFAAKALRRRGVDIRLRESVREIGPEHVILASGPRLPAGTVIWAAGIAPPPVLAQMQLPSDQRGYLLCERDLRVQGHANIWGIGDCAVNNDQQGHAYPATAQHALREGKACARNIALVLRGRPALPCDIRTQGSLAALGCRTGVAKVMGVRLSGFAAWWLWRTVYLLKMPGLGRKIRVAADWTLDLLFPRDVVQLGIHEHAASPPPEPGRQPSIGT
jgi:NADH:ubiquinone reductase (H+-translocating)